jgi:hypothetical protein
MSFASDDRNSKGAAASLVPRATPTSTTAALKIAGEMGSTHATTNKPAGRYQCRTGPNTVRNGRSKAHIPVQTTVGRVHPRQCTCPSRESSAAEIVRDSLLNLWVCEILKEPDSWVIFWSRPGATFLQLTMDKRICNLYAHCSCTKRGIGWNITRRSRGLAPAPLRSARAFNRRTPLHNKQQTWKCIGVSIY